MKLSSTTFAALAALLLAVPASNAATISADINYSFDGTFMFTSDSTNGSTFGNDSVYVDGGDGLYLDAGGNSSWSGGSEPSFLTLSRSIEAFASGANISASLQTTITLNFSQEGQGHLTFSWDTKPAEVTLTLNGNAIDSDTIYFTQGVNTLVFNIDYTGTSDVSNFYQVELEAIPEPGTWALLACGGVSLFGFARRRSGRKVS